MKRYILTGTPGAGKTSILHELKSQGYGVVEEATTEVIAREQSRGNREPHLRHDFIEHLGFCQQTSARKITFEESLVFERIHEATYLSLGYDLIKMAPAALAQRVHLILAWTRQILENP